MKKTLLLSAALLTMGFASAQTVQDIDTKPLKMKDGYTKITMVYPRSADNEAIKEAMIDQNRYAWEQQQQVVPQTANFYEGDYLDFKINNTRESQYILHFQYAVKTDGANLVFELYNGEDLEFALAPVYLSNEKSNWNALYDAMAFFDEDLAPGEYTLRMIFHHDNGHETANIANLWFEAKEQITYYSLYTSVYPEGAGTVKASPAANNYLENTSITLTATPASGSDEITYRFVNFTNEDTEEVFDKNPYSFEIIDNVSMIANFEAISSVNDIPGTLNLATKKIGSGKDESKAVKLDGSSYLDGQIVSYLCNYTANKVEQFLLNVTKAGEYTLICPTATKQEKGNIEFNIYDKAAYDADPSTAKAEATFNIAAEKTGGWQNFVTNKVEGIKLTEGKKFMTMKFTEPVANKYTVNVLYMSFGIGDDFGGTSAIDAIEVEDTDAPVKAYNLQGIPVDPEVAKGLIIINGKKVIR